MIELHPRPTWHADAKCADMDSELFDVDTLPATNGRVKAARERCAGCPVIDSCRQDAIDNWHAADGATSGDLRGVIRAGVPIPNGNIGRNEALLNLQPGARSRPRIVRPTGAKGGAAINATKTKCNHGHEYTTENTRIRPNGARACKQCERDRAREYQAAKRATKRAKRDAKLDNRAAS